MRKSRGRDGAKLPNIELEISRGPVLRQSCSKNVRAQSTVLQVLNLPQADSEIEVLHAEMGHCLQPAPNPDGSK